MLGSCNSKPFYSMFTTVMMIIPYRIVLVIATLSSPSLSVFLSLFSLALFLLLSCQAKNWIAIHKLLSAIQFLARISASAAAYTRERVPVILVDTLVEAMLPQHLASGALGSGLSVKGVQDFG